MAVRCSHCGEELMGSVNRCWKCGQQFTSRPGPLGMPPVRRAPVTMAATAELVVPSEDLAEGPPGVSGPPADLGPTGAPGASRKPVQLGPGGAESSLQVRRVGSPFAGRGDAGSSPMFYEPPPPPPTYPRNVAAVGGAIGALVLGILSLIGCFFSNAALVTGILGLVMGVWGLYSTRRGVAVAGLLVCFLAMSISSFNGAVQLYERMYGEHPFKPKPTLIGVPEDAYGELD